jgi:hypothetical protein
MGMIFFIASIALNSLMEASLNATIGYTIWIISSPPNFLGIILSIVITSFLWYKCRYFAKEN